MEEKKVASGKVAIVVADIDEKVQQEIVEQTKVIFAEQAELKGKEKEVSTYFLRSFYSIQHEEDFVSFFFCLSQLLNAL